MVSTSQFIILHSTLFYRILGFHFIVNLFYLLHQSISYNAHFVMDTAVEKPKSSRVINERDA